MRLTNKKALEKLKRKNKGNALLTKAINKLIADIDENDWKDQTELNKTRQEQMQTMYIATDFTFSTSIFIEQ
jgi:DNA anti-recombination protein RmuC